MAESSTLVVLRNKRDNIERYIISMEAQIKLARVDLAHVNATLRLFEVNGETTEFPVHMGLHRMFKRGEVIKICMEALAGSPNGLDTRELALLVIRDRDLDEADKILRQSVSYLVLQSLRAQIRRRWVVSAGKRKGVRIWRMATPPERAVGSNP